MCKQMTFISEKLTSGTQICRDECIVKDCKVMVKEAFKDERGNNLEEGWSGTVQEICAGGLLMEGRVYIEPKDFHRLDGPGWLVQGRLPTVQDQLVSQDVHSDCQITLATTATVAMV